MTNFPPENASTISDLRHFVTIFDSAFFHHGLALHASMLRHIRGSILWVVCVDDEVFEALSLLNLERLNPLRPSSWMTEELQAIRGERSRGEFCWTLTPFAPKFVFRSDPNVQIVTYLDADLWFLADPLPIFEELEASGKSVLITPHGYAPEYDQTEAFGVFCVQFMPFVRGSSEGVRQWWEDRCIEWCFNRVEDGKFGDQKYLDDWPARFHKDVHVLSRPELAQAPWNSLRNPIECALFFHFHDFRLGPFRKFLGGGAYRVSNETVGTAYQNYVEDLKDALRIMKKSGLRIVPSHRVTEKSFWGRIWRQALTFGNSDYNLR